MDVCELPHLDVVRPNFGIADGREALLHGVSQETSPLSRAILTMVKGIVEAVMIAEKIPGAWLVQIRGGGHGLMFQYPQQSTAVLETFLSLT